MEISQQNCQWVFLQAMIEYREFSCSSYLKQIESYYPFSFPVWKKLGERIAKEYQSLQKIHGGLADEI